MYITISLSIYMYINICMYVCMYVYIYIYILFVLLRPANLFPTCHKVKMVPMRGPCSYSAGEVDYDPRGVSS